MKITVQMLKAKAACKYQVDIFRAEWPNGCTASLQMAKRAAELELDLDFFARNFLSAPALKAYEDTTAPALKAYADTTATALKEYQDATAPAWKACQDAKAPALKAYQDAKAPALWAAWKMDHTQATSRADALLLALEAARHEAICAAASGRVRLETIDKVLAEAPATAGRLVPVVGCPECAKMREYICDHVHAFIDSDEIDRLMSYEEWCQLSTPNASGEGREV